MTGAPDQPQLIWHTYPLGLLGADQSGADRTPARALRELIDWLPHIEALGCDTVLLGPVFASLSHGYDTVDHRLIDDRLGTAADLDALVAAAAARSIGVVLDGAFAYASRSFWRLADPAEHDEPWFERDEHGALVPWRVDSLITADCGAAGYRHYVAAVMISWLDRGVAGFRLDSAWSVPDGFWRPVLARVRQDHPSAWFLGQVFDDDLPVVVNSATYSTATEYALMHGLREWLAGGPVDNIVTTLRVHAHNCSRAAPHTFVGNHDFARLADVIGTARVPAAFGVLLTVPGVPAVYYGDELGLTSGWTRGGSDAVLRPSLVIDDVAVTSTEAHELTQAVSRFAAFRRARPWLATAQLADVTATDDELTYRVVSGGDAIGVHVNRSTGSVTVE